MLERVPVVVVGAGPAGLATSYELSRAGISHVVLERGRVAQSWRDRWDSFCLVTPNWTMQLPGGRYDGGDPDGFMKKDLIVEHFERYANGFDAPVREGVTATGLLSDPSGGLMLETSAGQISADAIVLATGAFQKPHRPPGTTTGPAGVLVIDATRYTNPDQLPDGKVLIVGSGQTGCQIAEELHRAGRDVVVACGKAPWGPRRIEGRDIVSWLADSPFLEHTIEDLPSPLARLAANFQATGRDGGHDLHYRTLAADGVMLAGRLVGWDDTTIHFAPDLHDAVAWGDARYADIRDLVTQGCSRRGIPTPALPDPEPFKADPPDELVIRGFGAMIFTSGYRPDYRAWVGFPDAFDGSGFPIQRDGASTVVPGLYFMGTPFLRKRKSSTLIGMGEDAAIVVGSIASALQGGIISS